jgi:hypothetical protein
MRKMLRHTAFGVAGDKLAPAIYGRAIASARGAVFGLRYMNQFPVPPLAKRQLHAIACEKCMTDRRESRERAHLARFMRGRRLRASARTYALFWRG